MIKVARKEVKAPGFRDMKSVGFSASFMTCIFTQVISDFAFTEAGAVPVQVSESVLMPYLGGQLGAKAAAVEELIKFLPEVVLCAHCAAVQEPEQP